MNAVPSKDIAVVKGQAIAQVTPSSDYVTMTVAGQMFGIPVLEVHDILAPQRIAHIPLAPPEVAGSLNLRGRIVTSIDVRVRLGLPPCAEGTPTMCVVVEHAGDQYSLVVDQVGEVLSLSSTLYEQNPPTLDARWREVSNGIYRLETGLLVILDVSRLLGFLTKEAS